MYHYATAVPRVRWPPKWACSSFNQLLLSVFFGRLSFWDDKTNTYKMHAFGMQGSLSLYKSLQIVSPGVSIHHCQSPFIFISSISLSGVGTVALIFMKLLD